MLSDLLALNQFYCISLILLYDALILILSDINMPGMNGFDLVRQVSDMYPHIISILISAYGTDEYFKKAEDSGAKKYFEKPVDFVQLKKFIVNQFEVLKD